MAYAKKLGQQVAGGTPAAGLISTGGPQTAGAAGGAAPKAGGGYVNLQDYLKLNQPGAQAMGHRVSDYVGTEGKGVQDALAKAQADFQTQMQAGMGTNITAPTAGDPSREQGGVWVHGAPAPAAPPTPEELAALKAQSEQGYTGPGGLAGVTDVDALATKAQKASDDARMASTFGGLAGSAGAPGLIGQIYGGHSSQGGANLDAFLAGAGGGLGDLTAQYKGLGESLDKARAASRGQADAAAAETRRRAAVAAGLYEQGRQATRRAQRSHDAPALDGLDTSPSPREPLPKHPPLTMLPTFSPPDPAPFSPARRSRKS